MTDQTSTPPVPPRRARAASGSQPVSASLEAQARIQQERRQIMDVLKPVVQLMGQMLGPSTELVLHDLTQPGASVVAIANGRLTGRRVGSPILSGPKDDVAFRTAVQMTTEVSASGHVVVGVYPTISPTGSPLKSATAIYRDSAGVPFAALCMNADLSVLRMARDWLDQAIEGPVPEREPAAPTDPADMDLLIAEILDTAVKATGKPVALMTKPEKIQAVEQMLRRGLFVVKGGVPKAAKALNLSRYTIYNYLGQIKTG